MSSVAKLQHLLDDDAEMHPSVENVRNKIAMPDVGEAADGERVEQKGMFCRTFTNF